MGILNSFSLEGKVAWVTGASYGIGFAIATAYAQAGATIVFNDINRELVDKGLAAYKEKNIKAYGYVCDVTDEEAVGALTKQIETICRIGKWNEIRERQDYGNCIKYSFTDCRLRHADQRRGLLCGWSLGNCREIRHS